jgi:two-component system, OmpR family, sensor histidine kinase TctE
MSRRINSLQLRLTLELAALFFVASGAISVQDSGPGIPVQDRLHIFERFWRGKGVRTRGAGLGLAIVMEIARAHGASITVSDRVPRGARFDLRFRTA